MATLWITGAAGFTGRHLAAFLAGLPDCPRVVGVDLASAPPVPLDRYERLDLRDAAAVEGLARRDRPDWIIHLAGLTAARTELDLWDANVAATVGLIVGVAEAGCRGTRLLGIGSAAEYARADGGPLTEGSTVHPATPYGWTKMAQTVITLGMGQASGLHVTIARTFNLVGPGLSAQFVVGRLCQEFSRAASSGLVRLRHTQSARDFVDVRDVVDAYWRLARDGRAGEVYNVCSGRPVSLQEVIQRLSKVTGRHPRVLTEAAGNGGTGTDTSAVYGIASKLQRDTAWVPRIPLEQSLREMMAVLDATSVAAGPGASTMGRILRPVRGRRGAAWAPEGRR